MTSTEGHEQNKSETLAITEKPTWRHVANCSMHCLRDIHLWTAGWPWDWELGSFKISKSATIQ